MPTVTRFIIALCPATPTYLHRDTADASRSEGGYATSDKAKARVFDTFDAAMDVSRVIKGWGGAQRVEEIAVEVPAAPSLATPEGRIEIRDLATNTFHEVSNREQDNKSGFFAASSAISDLGFLVTTDFRSGASSSATITVTACNGSSLTLDWDPGVDGFDYDESGDDALDLNDDPEPTPSRTQLIQDALVGLSAEQKIVALVNTLTEAGITIVRDIDPDGGQRIAAVIPETTANWGSATVLTLEGNAWLSDGEIVALDKAVAEHLHPRYAGWNIIDISATAYHELETRGYIEISGHFTATGQPVVIDRKNL